MDDEKADQMLVTVAAMKLLLGRLYTLVYAYANLKEDDILAAHKKLKESLPTQAIVKSSDPSISDVFSDDVTHEIERFLQGVEKDFAQARKGP
jgi:hypothetical protein